MRVEIKSIPQREMRYPSLGDYFRSADGALHIKVQEFSDWRYEFLIALHELIEEALTRQRGIAELNIMAFDVEHLDSDDPGMLPDAPYHAEHVYATGVEMAMAAMLGVDWAEYERACLTACEVSPRSP